MKRFLSSAMRTGRFPVFSFILLSAGCFLLPAAVMAQVSAHFTADHLTGCGQLSVQFTDQSTGNPSSWNWDFGNGNHSTKQNPSAAFTSSGDYTVTLKVSNGVSVSTTQQTIHVYSPPKISFAATPSQGCAPLNVQFTDHSTGGSGSITSWTWDFGDGSPFSSNENPSHTYDSAGTFVVRVSITNSAGCVSSASNQKIVTDQGAAVSFAASDTFSCADELTTQFKATSAGTKAVSYLWDFGDGTTAAGQSSSHTYKGKGIYTVTLTASVGGVCSYPITRSGYINVGNAASDFIVPQGCANAPLTFKNTSVPLPSAATWTFSDGGTATGVNATHVFKTPGTYSVTLTNNYGGCTSSVTKSITTYPSPKADFSVPAQVFCGKPASVAFSNLSTGATSWKWRFGDSATSADQAPTHGYVDAGSYTVSLIATNANGCTDSVAKPGYIKVDAPDIQFNAAPGYGCVPLTSTFGLPPDSANDIATYAWDFGDGATSGDATPSHEYTTAGTFSVNLKVTTKLGCSFTFSRPDYIHTGMKPVVDFDATPTSVCLSKPVQFTNKSNPPGSIWTWNFPDDHNRTDSLENPLYYFSTLGPQDVNLTVTNNGCTSSLTKTAFITVQPPLASFAVNSSCADPYTVRFTDQSTPGTATWRWDFGDGTNSTDQNPSHTYKTSGIKNVILYISNGSCGDSVLMAVPVIDEHPTVNVPAGIICHGSRISLSAGNINFPQFVSSVTFNSGDGTSTTVTPSKGSIPPASFTYQHNGSYTPSLVVADTNGCRDTVAGPVITVQGPSAAFTTSTGEICQGNRVTFMDNSTLEPSTAAITQWSWDYGDGQKEVTTTDSSVHIYTLNGKFPAGLKITDSDGCSDSIRSVTSPLIVHPSQASFTTLDTMVCPGSVIHWDNTSQGEGTSYLWDFGDGTTSTLANPPAKAYAKDSVYSVSLHITTTSGCRDSLTRTAYIRVGTPKAVMQNASPVKVCSIFKDTAISLSENASGILWDFGDGTVSAGDTAFHLYNIPGTYIQTLTVNGFSAGCAADTQRRITITGPVGHTILDDTSGCDPHTVHFSAKDVTTAVKYQWDFGNGDYSDALTSPQATYTYHQEGIYHPKLLLTDANNCTVIIPINDTLTVIVDSIGMRAAHAWPEVCDSNKVTFGTQGNIFSQQKLGKTPTYFWDFGDPRTVDDISDQAQPSYRYTRPGTYYPSLTVTTLYGCREMLQDTVTIPDSVALRVMAAANPSVICQGVSVQLSAASNRDVDYNWTPVTGLDFDNQETVKATPSVTTTYLVTASTKDKCQTDTAAVQIVVHPVPQVDAGQDQTVSTGSVVQLQATGSSDVVDWSWKPTDYLSCTHCADPLSTPRQPITYTLTGTTPFGCTDSSKMTIHLVCDEGKVFIPNTFTPNNDGVNDLFYPRGRGVKTVLYFRIFDRYGQLIFERTNFPLNDKTAGWDGTYKGRKLDPAVFVYSTAMICDNNQVFKLSGNITLLR